jgi:5,10-methylene-tetrahydrofolate dehydrogenase/methenyl tetrahydrofolate cyclohydrolase
LLLGKAIAQPIHNKVAQDVSQKYVKVPTLAVIIVGVKEYSQTYVRMKRTACAEVGLKSINADLPRDVSEENLLDAVLDLKADREVHGILFHLPLPSHINENKIQSAINIEKAERELKLNKKNQVKNCVCFQEVSAEKPNRGADYSIECIGNIKMMIQYFEAFHEA